jgi:hypothetical protein
MNQWLSDIKQCIQKAEKGEIIFEDPVLSGLSGKKLICLLQQFANQLKNNNCYLEVGVFQGLTLLSVAKVLNKQSAYGIDNFKQFDQDGKNLSIVKDRIKKLDINNAKIINEDYEDALNSLDQHLDGEQIGLYFIDGPHDYRSQLMCLLLAKPFLARDVVIIIDDSNYHHIRQANHDFLMTNPEYKLIFEAYSSAHPHNLNGNNKIEPLYNWWNGVNVMIKDYDNQITPMYPLTERDRILFENDHLLHSSKYPEALPLAANLINVIKPFRLLKLIYRIFQLNKTIHHLPSRFIGKYDRINTFSENLESVRINPSLITQS